MDKTFLIGEVDLVQTRQQPTNLDVRKDPHNNRNMQSCITLLKSMVSRSSNNRLPIHAPRFIVDHTIENLPVCDATAMVARLGVHAVTNVIEYFAQALLAFKTDPILESGIMTWLDNHLSPFVK
ncbi:hypothetical protein TNCV_746031 [Trichonephila clavipes]|nr:hypothetical protein TNCV_746031 [Trichonephila clavipes]